jgi:hypothetical protein
VQNRYKSGLSIDPTLRASLVRLCLAWVARFYKPTSVSNLRTTAHFRCIWILCYSWFYSGFDCGKALRLNRESTRRLGRKEDETIVYRLWNLNFGIIYLRNVPLLSFKFQLWPQTHFDLLYEISWLAKPYNSQSACGWTDHSQSV